MAIWPFGRKPRKSSLSTTEEPAAAMAVTRKNNNTTSSDVSKTQMGREASDRHVVPTLTQRPSRKDSQKRAKSQSRKLTKNNAPSMRNVEKVESIPAIPMLPEQRRKELDEKAGANRGNQQRRGDDNAAPHYYHHSTASATSLQPENFSVMPQPPTLQGKRSANDHSLPRRKSSKRKADDHAREQEIKAMSSPIPIPKRPTSQQPGMLARDRKSMPAGMNRKTERPVSNVSLPMQESMTSQLSVSSDQHAFKVSAFDALSPRPTIRYSGNPQVSPSGSGNPSRSSTRKDKQAMIVEEDMAHSRKRIDDLANDMDAGSIRELMERDRRRHEKHRRSERERLQRRLERKAAKQRELEDMAVQAAAIKEQTGDSNVQKQPESLAAPSREDDGTRTPESWLRDPSRENLAIEHGYNDPARGGQSSYLEATTPEDEREDAVLETAKAVRLSSTSMSPPMSPQRHYHEPSNLSQFSELAPVSTLDPPESINPDRRRESDTSGRFSSSWKSIFRRSDTRARKSSADRGRVTPSEFSNTSRESFMRQMPPSAFTRLPRATSATPARTQSRFREDLPELPISPPDSRLQSPETMGQLPVLPGIPGSRGTDTAGFDASHRLSDIHPAYRDEVALSRQVSLRATSPEKPSNLSQSLASVDSEGSWLTGRPVKRVSLTQPLQGSAGTLSQQIQAAHDPEEEDNDVYDEDAPGTPEAEKYMGSLMPATPERQVRAPSAQRRRPYMHPTSTGTLLTGGEHVQHQHQTPVIIPPDQEGTWHGPVGKHPTIVRHGPGNRARSREGLLNDFQQTAEPAHAQIAGVEGGDVSPDDSSPQSAGDSPGGGGGGVGHGPSSIQRATSVDLGKVGAGHARHISAGSARLLDLPPRSPGVEGSKRFSSGSGSGSAEGRRSPLR